MIDSAKCAELAELAGSIPRLCHRMELAWLVGQASKVPTRLHVVNLGVWQGASVAALAYGRMDAILHDGAPKVIAVDHFVGSVEHQADDPIREGNLRQLFDGHMKRLGLSYLVKTWAMTMTAASQAWDAGPTIGLLFLDGSHDYDSVREDVNNWLPLVAMGGVVAFHDYGSVGWPQVRQAVDEANRGKCIGNIEIVGSMLTGVRR